MCTPPLGAIDTRRVSVVQIAVHQAISFLAATLCHLLTYPALRLRKKKAPGCAQLLPRQQKATLCCALVASTVCTVWCSAMHSTGCMSCTGILVTMPELFFSCGALQARSGCCICSCRWCCLWKLLLLLLLLDAVCMRQVVPRAAPVIAPQAALMHTYAGAPAAGVPIYNAPAHVAAK